MNASAQDLVIFYPEGHQAHYEKGHPESPERVETLRQALDAAGWWESYPHVQPIIPETNLLESVHHASYLDILKTYCRVGRHLDSDTYTTPASWQLALNAAGGAIATTTAVWEGTARRGFALCRPPGHHATPGRGMGFCLLNNIALAAEYLVQQGGAKRLAIVDLDLHHGNGTQEVFWTRGDVFYISTHQSPLYPGTGDVDETGYGPGAGKTANFPLPPGTGDNAFHEIMEELILPLLDRHQPQMILVSFGFDPHWRDPLGHLQLSARGYGELITRLTGWADRQCNGRIALFLEGGYDLEAAFACGQAVTAALLGQPWEDPLGSSPRPEGNSWKIIIRQAHQIWGI